MSGHSSPEENSLDRVKEEIHALLCTFKGSVKFEELLKDYQSICGTSLPYLKLGFPSAQELLKNIPDVVSCNLSNGSLFVRAIPKNESAHINKLVQGQRAPKRPPPRTIRDDYHRDNKSRDLLVGKTVPVPLLRNPIHPSSFNRNGAQHRPVAPWNAPTYYQPPAAMRSFVVVPPNSSIRQPMMPRPLQHAPPRQLYQPPQLKLSSQTPPIQTQKLQPVQQRPLVNLQLPGLQTNSSARTAKPIAAQQPLVRSKDIHREKLQQFVKLHNLGEITFEDARMKNGKYVATVIIDKKRSSCYPDEFMNVDDAYEKAAEIALDEWESKYQNAIKKMLVTSDNDLMAKRVVEIVIKYPAGCWSEALFQTYAESYGESLPEDWVQRVQSVTKQLDFTPILENFLVCMAHTPKAVDLEPNLESESKPFALEIPKEVSFDRSISEYLKQPDMKTIESRKSESDLFHEIIQPIPAMDDDNSFWMVHVLVVYGGDRLAIRRTDTDQYRQLEELMHDMDMFYSNESAQTPVGLIEHGRLYAVHVDGLWARVELIDYVDDGNVRMSLVDYADTEHFSVSAIFPLEPRFGELPAQGMTCHLYGLSSFSTCTEAVTAAVERLVDSRFVAQVVSRDPQLSVILYESSSGRELNMNEWILNQVAQTADSKPLKVGPVMQNSVISYVSSAFDVYMLRDTPQQNVVNALVLLVALRAEDAPVATTLTPNSVYLGRSDKHGWCRMRLYSNIPTHDGNFPVQLIDYGDTELVAKDTLRDLQTLSPVLARMADQAVRVLLARVPPSPSKVFTDNAAKTLRKIAPPELSLMVRVLEFNNGIPVVELFERLHDGKLVTINATLETDETLYKSADPSLAPSVLPKAALEADLSQRVAAMPMPSRKSSTSSSPSPTSFQMDRVSVPEAEIPQVDTGRFKKSFDVRVFNISNPDHFYVQPLQTTSLLTQLEHRLKVFYNEEDPKKSKLDSASLIVNGFYAASHSKTESYRRIQILAKCGESFTVAFVDWGEMDLVQLSDIRPLLPEFAELPAQALKAQLYGVKPTDGDWSPQNVLFFKKIVDGQFFASYVMAVKQDRTLCLQLIKMSDSEDISVSDYLVEHCHAIAV